MRLRFAALGLVLAGLVAAGTSGTSANLRDGDMLGPSNWEGARGLLPDEILEHYRTGEYQNRILDLAAPGLRSIGNPPDFQAGSLANRGRFTLTPEGSIVEVATGKPPAYLIGLPFPDIDPGDPQAGTKILWNNLYAMYYRGDSHFLSELVMLSRGGVERRIATDVVMRTYDGSPESRDRDNPDDLVLQMLARVVAPADLDGTISLTWRYRAGDRHDAVWTYVPGLRRPRLVNPLNRSDGFLGSDISLDDGPFFDGKPESFRLQLLGRQDMLVLIDPFSVRGEAELLTLPGGGYRTVWKDVPRIGADDPSWRGLPWAPVSAVLVRRPVWVVEAVPKDPNYLYGRILLRFDAETFRGSWATKYDRAGRVAMSYQIANGAYVSPDDGKTYVNAGGIVVQTSENFVFHRATTILFPPRNPKNPADYRVPTSADAFNPNVLTRGE